MKFTSEMLMEAMGIKIGDTIKLNGKTHTFTIKKDGTLICKNVLKQLIDQDFEILPKPKRVGDLKCSQFDTCETWPLQFICNLYDSPFNDDNSLYNILTKIDVYDQEIYNLLKARLDKEEVEE